MRTTRSATSGMARMMAMALLAGSSFLLLRAAPAPAQTAAAGASLKNAAGETIGAAFFLRQGDRILVVAAVEDLPPGFHGVHVHATGACTAPSFASAGGHLNPAGAGHPGHDGDMPVLLVNADGIGAAAFTTDRFEVADLFDADGSAVIVHANPDNYANIPPARYSNPAGVPDSTTTATGDAGGGLACGVVEGFDEVAGGGSTELSPGYWMAAADGGVFAFGDAPFLGSLAGQRPSSPIVAMAATSGGQGYWLAAADGGVSTFGDAPFLGGLAGQRLNSPIVAMAPGVLGLGYWLAAADGGVFAFGDAPFLGSMGGLRLNSPIVAMAGRPPVATVELESVTGTVIGSATLTQTNGNVLVQAEVDTLPPGFHGFHIHSAGVCTPPAFTSALGHLNPLGAGHPGHAGDLPPLLVNEDGTGRTAFLTDRLSVNELFDSDGSALVVHANPDNYANIPADRYSNPAGVPDVTTTLTGDAGGRLACGVIGGTGDPGYWMAAADGGVFAFGSAPFRGSTGSLRLNSPIVGMAATRSGEGYWMAAADGGVFAFGDAAFLGSTGALRLNSPVVSILPSGSGNGYWLIAADGGVFAFGDAPFLGGLGGLRLNSPVVAAAAVPQS